ncbi:DUF4232 domain-containing protein [Streptomyces sp. 891-h]|uniref:DUF4232 domain-containing protein n=1 Tax=Streptomyces sp. 891-h TaxID=2720714 RepID=UPI001FA9860D|nr:DUF4232 domain-containing protein [Streptomyces sp. 891-h]UNZ17525.1 DUF4232 domain-containing protein [Streptomyces sp. 891-h]
MDRHRDRRRNRRTDRRTDKNARPAAVAAVGLAAGLAAAVLTGCGTERPGDSGPKKVAGEAAPAPADSPSRPSRKGGSSPSSSSKSRDGGADNDKRPSASSQDSGGSSSSSGAKGGSGAGTPESNSCKTSGLAFSTSHGMAEGTLLVNLRNSGSAACTLKGFPGVDLRGEAGSLHATRNNNFTPSTVTLQPGETTRFTLSYPPNNSGGSGVNITSLVVTPPNETQSRTLPVSINLPVTDGSGTPITVGPVGSGK